MAKPSQSNQSVSESAAARPELDDESLESQDDEGSKEKSKADDETLRLARDRFKLCEDAEDDQRRLEIEDKKFLAGDHWPEEVKNQRAMDGRPCLVINRLPQFVNQIANEQRQNRPAIKVFPFGDGAKEEIAKIRQGLIRNIEYSSDADVAYDRAFHSCVATGRGFYRLYTEYCDPESFDQDICFGSIDNSHSVYIDPDSRKPDGSDAQYGFITTDYTKDGFRSKYPNSKLAVTEDWSSFANRAPGWIADRSCRVCDYYFIDSKPATLLKFKSGATALKEDLEAQGISPPENDPVIDQRETRIPIVRLLKINGVDILERTELPGQFIPIFPVYGNENVIDGKRTWEGIVRHAKDPQRAYDYWASAETEAIALAPKAPFVGYEGQFRGYENEWKTANTKNHAYLEVVPITIGGQAAPFPQRQAFEPAVQAITQARMAAAEDVKATTGMYDASFGNRSNEQSGIAVERRVAQGQTTNFHFVDNLSRTIKHSGRVIDSWLPYFYDTARTVRIVNPDDTNEMVLINQEFEHKGERVNYQMDVGTYDVGIDVGPSFASRRIEAVQSMLDLYKVLPPAAQASADLLVKNMDWPGKDEVAERLKKLLPPGIADDPDQKNQPIPPQVQQQMQQMSAMISQLSQHLHAAQDEIDQKKIETDQRKMDLESKERIALVNAETQLRIALMKTDSVEAIEAFRQEVDMIHKRLELLQVQAPIDDEIEPGDQSAGAQPPTGGQAPGQSPADGQSAQSSTGGASPGPFMGG